MSIEVKRRKFKIYPYIIQAISKNFTPNLFKHFFVNAAGTPIISKKSEFLRN